MSINIYQLFLSLAIDGSTDKIKYLLVASKNANGKDIIFNKCYKVKTKETIELNLKFQPNENLANYSKLFVMRSRFSRIGLHVSRIFRNK